MIAKFKSDGEIPSTLEIEKTESHLVVSMTIEQPSQIPHVVKLTPNQLFDMIGQLLRIQSQFKIAENGSK
jgi:hypothetical protein